MTIRQRISDAEWQARLDLAACYRLVARYGMADLIYNHITVRVPGEAGHILINPFGYLYEEITASCLYKIDLAGNVVDKPGDVPYEVNQAGYVIHSAIHSARHDIACVLHTHTRRGGGGWPRRGVRCTSMTASGISGARGRRSTRPSANASSQTWATRT